jgi:RNA polymerase sigma factor (sigma-70 family)
MLFLSHFCLFCDHITGSFEAGKERMQPNECSPLDNAGVALYERYAASIFAYTRLHTSSWEDAEDLTLEVFIAALEQDSLATLTEKQQFAWLRRVAQNKLVDRYRRSLHFSLLPFEQVIETVCTEEGLSPEQLIVRREDMERLHMAIRQLSEIQQQVLQLRVGDGLRFADIAVLLEKREAAVRQMYSRTLKLLRAIYEHDERGTMVWETQRN